MAGAGDTRLPLLYNAAAERAVLGSCLLGKLEIVAATRAALPPDPFYQATHAAIWRAVCALADAGVAPDQITVPARAKQAGERWDDTRDTLYVHELYAAAPLVANPAHAHEVANWARIRKIWEAGTRITRQVAAVADLGADVDHALDRLVTQVQGDMASLGGETRDDAPHSWRPVDIEPVLDGTWVSPQPTVGKRADGRGFLYPGRVHTAAGESEAGKTFFSIGLALAEMEAGNAVIHLDFEDDEVGVTSRYMAAGANREQLRHQFAYIHPYDPLPAFSGHTDLDAALNQLQPTLVTVDGVTEAMTLHGLDPLNNMDAAKFASLLLRWIALRGPAVLALDHVTKARDDRGKYALGAVHKLNVVNGAAFIIENRKSFGVGMTGYSSVLIAKDRPAMLRRHARPSGGGLYWYANLVVKSEAEEFVEVELSAPPEQPEEFRPTYLMAKVHAACTRAPQPLSQREIVDRVGGKRAQDVRRAIAFLVDDGYLTTAPGPYRSTLHSVAKPFEPEGVQMELPDPEQSEEDDHDDS